MWPAVSRTTPEPSPSCIATVTTDGATAAAIAFQLDVPDDAAAWPPPAAAGAEATGVDARVSWSTQFRVPTVSRLDSIAAPAATAATASRPGRRPGDPDGCGGTSGAPPIEPSGRISVVWVMADHLCQQVRPEQDTPR